MTAASTEDLLERLLRLCSHDTTSGREDAGLPELREQLASLGADVRLHEVAPGRTNVLALFGEPRVLFSTHLDTVPPFLPPARGLVSSGESVDGVRGRGSCDAKGQIVAQLAAIESLLAEGHGDLAWLGVVGEESDALGAAAASAWRETLRPCRLLVGGEPTDLRLATGQRGYLHLDLECAGRAAHSGSPERGRSAIWPLLDWLQRLRTLEARADEALGPEVWNLGRIDAGEAVNVVPARASAELSCRAVPGSTFAADVAAQAPPEGRVRVLVDEPPEHYPRLTGFDYAAMPFGSDVPALRRLVPDARVALAGCGRIEVAHTSEEHLTTAELLAGVALNRELALRGLDE